VCSKAYIGRGCETIMVQVDWTILGVRDHGIKNALHLDVIVQSLLISSIPCHRLGALSHETQQRRSLNMMVLHEPAC
jgi:hypothetical protein